jgi:hypothetical protein
MDGEAIGLRIIGGCEFDPGLHQIRDESYVPGQAVEFGDQKRGPVYSASGKGFSELRAVATTAAFDLGKLAD